MIKSILYFLLFLGIISCGHKEDSITDEKMISQRIAILHKAEKYEEAFKLAKETLQHTNSSKIKMQLGGMYQFGYGTEKNLNLAVKYYTESANSGDEYAQLLLGIMYLNGEGVVADLDKAKFFLEQSSKQGNSRAKQILKDLN